MGGKSAPPSFPRHHSSFPRLPAAIRGWSHRIEQRLWEHRRPRLWNIGVMFVTGAIVCAISRKTTSAISQKTYGVPIRAAPARCRRIADFGSAESLPLQEFRTAPPNLFRTAPPNLSAARTRRIGRRGGEVQAEFGLMLVVVEVLHDLPPSRSICANSLRNKEL